MLLLDRIAKLDKVLILGYAREGQSTENFLRAKFPHLQIDTADKKTDEKYLEVLKNYPLIIKTPGISPHLPEIREAKKAGVVFTSHMQLFFENCPSKKTIGVTGTKGKSTTASLIHHILQKTQTPSVLLGNIGKPALDYLSEITPDTWVVCELSSYQLMDLTTSPHIAVLQNIYPDHLDYHTDFAEYKAAKLTITKYQTPNDYFISQLDVPTLAHKILFSISDFDPKIHTKLPGSHNKLNIIPSLKIAELLHLNQSTVYEAISSFSPLDTRLEFVAEKHGLRFYVDTLATIPEATIAAIDAFPDTSTLIAGGHDRHQDYSQLAKKIIASHIQTVILFPQTGRRIATELAKHPHSLKIFDANSMHQAVDLAVKHTLENTICLFSPAAPNFTLFKDYKAARDEYAKEINNL